MWFDCWWQWEQKWLSFWIHLCQPWLPSCIIHHFLSSTESDWRSDQTPPAYHTICIASSFKVSLRPICWVIEDCLHQQKAIYLSSFSHLFIFTLGYRCYCLHWVNFWVDTWRYTFITWKEQASIQMTSPTSYLICHWGGYTNPEIFQIYCAWQYT